MAWPEWVYLDRGITLAIVDEQVSHLFLYAPTTMQDHLDWLGGQDDWIERRPRR